MNMSWIFAGACGFIAAYSTVQWFRYRNSSIWPTASCTVEKIEVQRFQDNGHYFRPVVWYSFPVGGEFYSGTWTGPAFGDQQVAREFAELNMPNGARLTTRYKPGNPSLNMLEVDAARRDPNAMTKLDL